jgi:hypothetical protein
VTLPDGPNQRWSLDFVSDALAWGRRFRILAIVDDFTASDARLLACASYREGQRREAERWFRRAGEVDASAGAARGLALVQIDEGAYAVAEATMNPWRDSSDEAEAVYLAAAANLLAGDPPPSGMRRRSPGSSPQWSKRATFASPSSSAGTPAPSAGPRRRRLVRHRPSPGARLFSEV